MQVENYGLTIKRKPVIVVHGGAGKAHPVNSLSALETVKKATSRGFEMLKNGGTSVESVTETVSFLEDSGLFNAGLGSGLNIEKQIEMEASVMDGKTLAAGAAGLLSDIRNPVRVARLVMEKTDHVFVVGNGAQKLADIFKLERRGAVTSAQLERYETQLKCLKDGEFELPKLASLINDFPGVFELETVGAVALDCEANLAAATSTGGFPLKLPGRIGDSPSIGCGTYADNETGACSATGIGEVAMRLVLAKTVCNSIEKGKTAQEAAEIAISLVNRKFKGAFMGLIAVDTLGNVGAAHCSPNLCWAYMNMEMQEPVGSLIAMLLK